MNAHGNNGADSNGVEDVIESVVDRVLRGGAAAAVIDGDGVCTRDVLAALVADFQRELVANGVRPGERVGVLWPRGRAETAALLAIWAERAVAVPLEPASPPARNRRILDGCGARFVLCDPSARVLLGRDGAPDPATHAPSDGVVGEAIILHTSGSTGAPKGVAVTRHGVSAFVAWMCREFDVRPGDRVAALAGPSFDLSLFEQLAPLWLGGAVVRSPERCSLSPRALAAFLDEHRVAFVYAVPSLWIHLLRAAPFPRLDALRGVLFAGEPFPIASLRRLRDALPGRAFANLFGPTETNVCVFHRLRDDEPSDAPLPIGLPCPHTDVVVVADDGNVGVDEGELCVRGPTVMTQYVGSDVAPSVVHATDGANPFLRTGDRVVRGADGLLRFRGRTDAMLKVRGYRVEPGEIEAALTSHAAVEDACVGVVPDPALGDVLVADVVLRGATPLDEMSLRAHAATLVPSWMVPVHVRAVPTLDRSDRGKRRAPQGCVASTSPTYTPVADRIIRPES